MSSQFYSSYLADDNISDLSRQVVDLILKTNPSSVFEFGCGTGKNLKLIQKECSKYATCPRVYGLDISLTNVIYAKVKNELDYVILGDQDWLPKLGGMDVIFTVSVLDHIENVSEIIMGFQRIAKHVFLAEPDHHDPDKYYWGHDYTKHGFKKTGQDWVGEDGNSYSIWEWSHLPTGESGNSFVNEAYDDSGNFKR